MTAFRADSRVGVERIQCSWYVLLRFGHHAAVVDEAANGHQLRQFHHTAVVVGMEVCDEQIVDARDTGVTGGGGDPSGITSVARITRLRLQCPTTRKPCVDEQRLPRRRHQQRGLTTFDIDEVDVERLGRSPARNGGR